MHCYRTFLAAAVLVLTVAGGCSSGAKSPVTNLAAPTSASAYVLTAEPAGAQCVSAVHKSAKNDAEIVIVGRVGGDAKPFVEGLTAFQIVDPALKPCSDEEGCATPWDYCCNSDLTGAKALVEVVDAKGEPLAGDARALLGIKELSTVVVQGKAQRDSAGNLTVRATGVYVRR